MKFMHKTFSDTTLRQDVPVSIVAADLIGSPIVDLFAVDAVHSLRNRLALLRGPDALERIFGCALFGDEKRFDVALHMSEGSVVVEAEPTSEHAHGDATGTVRGNGQLLASSWA